MPGLFLQTTKPLWRAVILFGMLAGLLFSSGEGIRLFPFAAAARALPNENLREKTAGHTDYEKNLPRLENGQKKQPGFGRPQPAPQQHWAGAGNFPDLTAAVRLFSEERFSAAFRPANSSAAGGSRPGRAPPPSAPQFL